MLQPPDNRPAYKLVLDLGQLDQEVADAILAEVQIPLSLVLKHHKVVGDLKLYRGIPADEDPTQFILPTDPPPPAPELES